MQGIGSYSLVASCMESCAILKSGLRWLCAISCAFDCTCKELRMRLALQMGRTGGRKYILTTMLGNSQFCFQVVSGGRGRLCGRGDGMSFYLSVSSIIRSFTYIIVYPLNHCTISCPQARDRSPTPNTRPGVGATMRQDQFLLGSILGSARWCIRKLW
jgi:hypothetical protein